MRITKINLNNFRAFYAAHEIDLSKKGKNLLIYGENGSGKSSLLKAIELFIDSHTRDYNFGDHRNFFTTHADGHVKISMRSTPDDPETTYEWSQTARETNTPIILDAAKTRGSLDYKSLLKIYFLQSPNDEIDVFELLMEAILSNSINNFTQRLLSQEWQEIQAHPIPRSLRHTKKNQELQQLLDNFNDGLDTTLQLFKNKVMTILAYFDYPIQLDFNFHRLSIDHSNKCITGNTVNLNIEVLNTRFPRPHQFLNEAKLSAIALSIYLASLLLNPNSDLKILVLDDVLIGLDMSNRLPIIDILKENFNDYQIFLMTYDKEWYEILKRYFPRWKTVELYVGRGTDYEVPVLVENKKYLEKAKFYFQNHDYKAAAIYLRTAFEVKIKWFCEKKNIAIKYREKPKDLDTNDFWEPIKNAKNPDNTPQYIDTELVQDIELYRSLVMNPLSHAQITTTPAQEIQKAIDTVERLEQTLNAIVNPS